MPVLYKEDGTVELQTLVKQGEEGELLAVVYAPENEDSQGDIASAEVIKDAAYAAMQKGVEIDIQHNLKSVGRDKAFVAESFLIQKGDPRFADFKDYDGKAVDLEGAWATVIKLEDEELRKQYREGVFSGVSMFGRGEVEEIKKADPIDQFLSKLAERLTPLPSEEIELTKEEMEALLAQREEALFAKMQELVKGSTPEPAPAPKPEELKFEGDPLSKADLLEHAAKLKSQAISKTVDMNDLSQVETLLKSLGDEPEVTSRVSTLEKTIAQILKGSNVEQTQEAPVDLNISWRSDMLTKSDVSHIARGRAYAASLGYGKPEAN